MAQDQSAFEAMPLEIHFNVLIHISGPEHVLSTIRASPAALRALQTGRERIFAAALQNGVASEVFREFLAILHAPDHNTCVGPRQTDAEWAETHESILEEWKTWEQKAGGFLRSHALGADYPTPNPKTNPVGFKTQTRLMIRLYFCVSRHINSYLTYARSRVTGTRIDLPPSNQAGSKWPPLTDVERLRLQRGLLRFELCCRLIGVPSIVAYCNSRVFAAVVAPQRGVIRDFWEHDPFTRLLPVDEIEEVICASEFADGLYSRLRCSFVEDFQKAILDLGQCREEGVRDQHTGDSKEKKTVTGWLSKSPLEGGYHPFQWGGQFGSRLGLVFLDRVIRSSPTDRRELMRAGFHTFRELYLHRDNFLRAHWHNVVYLRGFAPLQDRAARLEVGPHCNAILKTCSTNYVIAEYLTNNGPSDFRRLGWAFFDDHSRLRSLGLPQDGRASSIREWLRKDFSHPRPVYRVKLSESALASRFTEDEWEELFEKYSPKDLGSDFSAMCRFVADARAVVDFSSNRVPQMG